MDSVELKILEAANEMIYEKAGGTHANTIFLHQRLLNAYKAKEDSQINYNL